MEIEAIAPWAVLAVTCGITWMATPRRVTSPQFFDGRAADGAHPGIWLVAISAAITWIFAKSIANASDLAYTFGLAGGVGYTLYYISFVVAGIAIYLLRTRGRYRSLAHFLIEKYGMLCSRLFLLTIAFRLFNEVWSNTKVMALYFGTEGSPAYWIATVAVTAFTLSYAWTGGMRASLLTDRIQTILAFVLLGIVLAVLFPGLSAKGLPQMPIDVHQAGLTFCLLALVQVLSYPFHDPVLTDRAFLTPPRQMLKSFLLAALISGGFIFLFSLIGLYARASGLPGSPSVSVPAAFGLMMMLVFTGIMLLSGCSTIDSTFTSVAKLVARDWRNDPREPARRHLTAGRIAVLAVAVIGNLPLLTVYLGDKVGPAVIAATTISGTMVMGLAPIFLLSWIKPAGRLSFHLAFWPGLAFGVLRTLEVFLKVHIFPADMALGVGKYAIDLGVNVWGLLICTTGYLLGAMLAARRQRPVTAAAGHVPVRISGGAG
ncbi:Na+/proline symporter [Defluviicoccus vanus]|uniref:Na+/proline symporter n=1 Tax=Defluviicoccus vanus TaxID=111831 RepID=A0A7H1MXZ3_9PROT|nr:Na+/proline symporter [Defluviicoccus vanus]